MENERTQVYQKNTKILWRINFYNSKLNIDFFYINTRPVKTEYKLHISHTKSGRPVVYLQDEITGKVEMVNHRNVEYFEKLKRKYNVIVKEWFMKLFKKIYESKLFDVSLMVVFIFTTALWIYKLIELIIGGIK